MNNEKPIGFNGISFLASTIEINKHSSSKEVNDEQVIPTEIVSTVSENGQSSKPTESNQDDSSSEFKFNWKYVSIFIIVVFVIIINQKEETHKINFEATNTQRMTFTMPQPGTSRVLGTPELNWCLREEIILDTFKVEFNVNKLSGKVTDKYNSLIDRYNARCSSYKYYQTKFDRATREIGLLKNDIERKAIIDFKELSNGDVNNNPNKYDVLDVQKALNRLGYNTGVADGVMGKRTRTAIKAYQKDRNLIIDGMITSELLSRLNIR